MQDPLERYEVDLGQRLELALIDEIADAPHVWVLAHDLLSGEMEMDKPHIHITDSLEWSEALQELGEQYGATSSQIEQAIEVAKSRLVEEDNEVREIALAIGTWIEPSDEQL